MLGDSRTGKLADNLTAFGRALRRAGVPLDSSRIALAHDAAALVGVRSKPDLSAALEAALVSREQDRLVFRELFDAFFRNPDVANKLLAQMLPSAEGRAEPSKRRPRVREALSPQRGFGGKLVGQGEQKLEFDAAMTASDAERLRQADFNQLSAAEFALVERTAREITLPLPRYAARRAGQGARGAHIDWPGVLRAASRTGGEPLRLPRRTRQQVPHPLLVLVDVSGSMERYSRLLLAFLHAATRAQRRREVFAFGTQLTDLSAAFQLADSDAMLLAANRLIQDFAGGTRLGCSLSSLREQHARKLTGRRTLVLLITDGLDTGEPQALKDELQWLKRHCGRLLWLNPLLRFEGYAPLAQGAATLHAHVDAMLAVHNLASLEQLAQSLARLMKQ
jgi:uncharacterized protein with von Willebrand factor type A (vWA) domain